MSDGPSTRATRSASRARRSSSSSSPTPARAATTRRAWRRAWPCCQRAGGVVMPLVTTLFAFAMAMIVIAATGHNPFKAFKGIFDGTGSELAVPVGDGRRRGRTPRSTSSRRWCSRPALILTGFAVSFAFKCGLFNIGGQGQYIVGAFIGVWVGSSWANMASGLHIFLAIVLAALAGAAWAAIAGFLKATVGVHEVISTIMLNWIAILGDPGPGRPGRPAPEHRRTSRCRSRATSSTRRTCRCSGATRCSRACTSASSSRSARRSSSG